MLRHRIAELQMWRCRIRNAFSRYERKVGRTRRERERGSLTIAKIRWHEMTVLMALKASGFGGK